MDIGNQSTFVTRRARCACGAFDLAIDWPSRDLPVRSNFCSCTACRKSTGSLAVTDVSLPEGLIRDPEDFHVTAYHSTKAAARYFCSTCGAYVLWKARPGAGWNVTTSIIDIPEGVVEFPGFIWVGGTLDGGLSSWLKQTKEYATGHCLKDGRQSQEWDSSDPGSHDLNPAQNPEARYADFLSASCHCGGIKFYISRPDASSRSIKSPWPDLIKPYHSNSSDNPHNETWWLCAKDTKYRAGTCVCVSCRKSLGCEVQAWAFIPRTNIFGLDGMPLDFSNLPPSISTLTSYRSSEGVSREFCGGCGATVFWHCDERPDLIDVSVGILNSRKGARAEDWLEWWTERVSFKEDAVNRQLAEALEEGLKIWGSKQKST